MPCQDPTAVEGIAAEGTAAEGTELTVLILLDFLRWDCDGDN